MTFDVLHAESDSALSISLLSICANQAIQMSVLCSSIVNWRLRCDVLSNIETRSILQHTNELCESQCRLKQK